MIKPRINDVYLLTDGTHITVVRISAAVVVIEGEYDPPRRWWPWPMWDIYTLGAVLGSRGEE